jgi:hypothetical protein
MIVYANRKRRRNTVSALRDLQSWPASTRDDAVALLIEFGELEAGITDRICADMDVESEVTRRLARCSVCLGHLLLSRQERWIAAWRSLLCALLDLLLPPEIEVSTPEGYAWYGLDPESYATAANRFAEEESPRQVIVIGIRSIGTSLSGVVAAALQQRGIEVERYTVRPRGHPFDRYLRVSRDIIARWRSAEGACFAVVDEGPGLSGSSFTSVVRELSAAGIPDGRIALFPSSMADHSAFVSESARLRWPRHKKYTGAHAVCPVPFERELSGGNWRKLFYTEQRQYPAVQPQHERLKYLVDDGRGPSMVKFSGMGRYGLEKLERGGLLAQEGFTPPVERAGNGYLLQRLAPGLPLVARTDAEFLDRIAAYLKCLVRLFPSGEEAGTDELLEMTRVNVQEGLGADWEPRLEAVIAKDCVGGQSVAIDGRMFPHEWIFDGRTLVKSDALDHHDDHFFPGRTDIAWDLAGAFVEFGMGPAERGFLLARFGGYPPERLAFYEIAYLAFRLGYALQAALALGSAPDGRRFRRMAGGYRRALKNALAREAAA